MPNKLEGLSAASDYEIDVDPRISAANDSEVELNELKSSASRRSFGASSWLGRGPVKDPGEINFNQPANKTEHRREM